MADPQGFLRTRERDQAGFVFEPVAAHFAASAVFVGEPRAGQQVAQAQDLLVFQRRIVADVAAKKVQVIRPRVFLVLVRPEQAAQVRLPQLIAASGRAAAAFDRALRFVMLVTASSAALGGVVGWLTIRQNGAKR